MDAPEIDSFVYVNAGSRRNLLAGDMRQVRITGSRGYDLIGELDESTQ